MVVSADHHRLNELVSEKQRDEVDKFLKKLDLIKAKDIDRMNKEGVFSGSYAINPANGEKVPIWIGNFVVADYGCGMVMAVPAHDQRDFDFAKKYGINIKWVITPDFLKGQGNKAIAEFVEDSYSEGEAYAGNGILGLSEKFDGLENTKAKEKITDWLIKNKAGKKVVNFKLRDWGVSRQRYWGTPIPVIHCDKCGAVAVPEKDLPVKLPKDVKFGKGNPLETNEKWLNVKCPKCGGAGKRESDTMDTFVNSSWYFMRYCDPNNDKKIFDPKKVKYWCPVDTYIGGAEHACMHLIYSRFYVKFLRDLGLVDFDEPAMKLFHQGMLHGEDGEKMSKSKGNGVLPEVVSEKYGIDTARFFLSGLASPDKNIDWSEKGINGSLRFVKKVIDLYSGVKVGNDSDEVLSKLNETVKNVGAQIDSFDYRTATIRLKELFDLLAKQKEVSKVTLESALKMLAPFCPHVAEELWERLREESGVRNQVSGKQGDFISVASWPEVDESKILKKGQGGDLNGKIVEDVNRILEKVGSGAARGVGVRGVGVSGGKEVKRVYVYVMPFELGKVDVKKIGSAVGKDVEVFAVNDSGKYDPEGKAKRAKPGKASVYVE
jgi:leucyl-tRNA synthetase